MSAGSGVINEITLLIAGWIYVYYNAESRKSTVFVPYHLGDLL